MTKVSDCCGAANFEAEDYGICPACKEHCDFIYEGDDEPPLCSWCNGTGQGDTPDTTCPKCKGSGIETIKFDPEP